MSNILKSFWEDKYKVALFFILIFLIFFSIFTLKPHIAGDSLLYTSSIEVLQTGIRPADFVPMMVVSTYLGLRLLMFLNLFTGHIETSWLLLDGVLYIVTGLLFYSLLKRIVSDAKVAFVGTLFLMTNYAAVTFGLGYLMDMGGWAAYMASIYFSYRYLESDDKWIYVSAFFVGLGGLYKEYAFVACIVIAGAVIWKHWNNWKRIFFTGVATVLLAFIPIVLLNIYGYFVFHYTYLDWFAFNQGTYAFQNRGVEFIKSFGSIYNFGWFLFVPGFYLLLRRNKETLKDKNLVFIWLVSLSSCAVLLWPVVTRVLFITMPGAVLVSSLFIQKIRVKWWVIIPIFALYFISAYLMDAFILNFVNLPF